MFKRNKAVLSAERALYLKKRRSYITLVNVVRVLIIAALVVLWEMAGRWGFIDPFIMSMPSRIVKTVANLWREGNLFYHIGISCLETVIGFIAGTLIGSVIAMLLWWSKFLSKTLEPYLVVLSALPKVALGPIFIVWVGAGMGAIIVMTLAISLIVTVLEVLGGFLATDEDKIKLMHTFGASRSQIFFRVVIPYNIPTFAGALKINVGLSWIGVIMGEFLVSKAGIGYLIVYGSQVFKMDLVMSSVIILAVAAAVMYELIVLVERAVKKRTGRL